MGHFQGFAQVKFGMGWQKGEILRKQVIYDQLIGYGHQIMFVELAVC
jgi:hypothetical protein